MSKWEPKTYVLKNGQTLLLREAVPDDAPRVLAYLNRVGGESDNLLFGKDGFPMPVERERAKLMNPVVLAFVGDAVYTLCVRQRLALAVNLLANKSIYIFDEATSNIDGESERVIMDGVKKLSRRAAVVLISHRMANVTCADNIYVLDGGMVAESGTHEQLMQKGGVYAGLYKTQKALEEGGEEAL